MANLQHVALVTTRSDTRDLVSAALRIGGLRAAVSVASAAELAGRVETSRLAAVLLDIDQGESASGLIAAARSACPAVPLVGLYRFGERRDPRRIMRLGVRGIVDVGQIGTHLVATVRAVGAGFVCVPQDLRGELSRENLSGRERQVLAMVVTGCTNAEIGARLYLAESTVKSHLSSAYVKLGVRSRQDAASLIRDPSAGLDRGILEIFAA